MYCEQDLKKAADFREEIHKEALARVRAVCPCADRVVDKYPADEYFQKVWDYPGQWYTAVGTPPGAGSRKDLVSTIVRATLAHYRHTGAAFTDGAFYRLIAEYPALGCAYCLINAGNRSAQTNGVFPYRGADSHRLALACAAREPFPDGKKRAYDLKDAKYRKLSGKALFAPIDSDRWLNYRKAFLCPPRGNAYPDDDFERVNAVLVPGGADGLEVYRWTAGNEVSFDGGGDRQDALCLTVYDKTLDRFVVVTAQATDE